MSRKESYLYFGYKGGNLQSFFHIYIYIFLNKKNYFSFFDKLEPSLTSG